MRPEDLRAFARRDWPRVARAKLAYWTEQYEQHAAAPALRAAAALRAHVLRFARDRLQAQRALDLADHVTLKRRIDAADDVLLHLREARRRAARLRGHRKTDRGA